MSNIKEKVDSIIDTGWRFPSSEEQLQACKLAIDTLYNNSDNKVELLIELKEFILKTAEIEQENTL